MIEQNLRVRGTFRVLDSGSRDNRYMIHVSGIVIGLAVGSLVLLLDGFLNSVVSTLPSEFGSCAFRPTLNVHTAPRLREHHTVVINLSVES